MMTKKLLALFFCVATSVFSQNEKNSVSGNYFEKGGFLRAILVADFGLETESYLSKNFTFLHRIYVPQGALYAFLYASQSIDDPLPISYESELRMYHNLGQRVSKGRKIRGFSGNYFYGKLAVPLNYFLLGGKVPETHKTFLYTSYNLLAGYGLQRSLGSWVLGGNLGVGIGYDFTAGNFFPGGEVRIFVGKNLARLNPLKK